MIKIILNEIVSVFENFKEEQFSALYALVKKAPRVFVCGSGRSGLVGKCFAMRLKHLGKEVYVVGETICSAIGKGDVLVAVSFSGNRFGVLHAARVARDSGAAVVLLTASTNSELIKLSEAVICFPAGWLGKSVQAGNSLFEQAVFLFLEAFILFYQRKAHILKSAMKKAHTNLE